MLLFVICYFVISVLALLLRFPIRGQMTGLPLEFLSVFSALLVSVAFAYLLMRNDPASMAKVLVNLPIAAAVVFFIAFLQFLRKRDRAN